MSSATSMLCPIMIGRDNVFDTFLQCLADGFDGHGHTLLVMGEAGIGKSRFVNETLRHAATQNVVIMQGSCFERDQSFPFAPLLDLLRARCAGAPSDEIATYLGATAPDLFHVMPELRFWLPEIVPSPMGDPEQAKRRIFAALAEVVLRPCARQPVLLVVEDIHWCDASSLEFLLFLARQALTQPLIVLLTLRSDEIDAQLDHALATLQRSRLATEIALNRLSAAELDVMLRAMFIQHGPLQAEFLHTMYAFSEGNPFFVEEIVNALVASGEIYNVDGVWNRKPMQEMHLPRTVRDAVLRRHEQLSQDAQSALSVAAVAGRRFDFALLARLTGYDDVYLLTLIKEMIAAQLVVEESADAFVFRHALTQQAIYQDLLVRERKTLHRAIAIQSEHLFFEQIEAHITDLAWHFYAAGDWQRALHYARLVGAKAQTLYAPHAAVEHFTHALDAAHHLHQPPPLDVLLARGQAYEMLGEFDAAQTDYLAMLATSRAQTDQRAEWSALVALGMLWAGRDYSQTETYYQAALDLATTLGDQALLARSLNRIGNWYVNQEVLIDAQRCHVEALAIFEEINDATGIAETCDFLGMAYILGADLRHSMEYYTQAISYQRTLDNRQGLVSSLASISACALAYQCTTLVPTLTLTDAQRSAVEAQQIAHTIGQRSGEAYASFILGCVLGAHGQWGDALAALETSLAIATEIDHRQWMCAALGGIARVWQDLLDLPVARQHAEDAFARASAIGSGHWVNSHAGYLIAICAQQCDFARAEAILAATFHPTVPAQTIGQRLLWCANVELLLAQQQPEVALQRIQALIAITPHYAAGHEVPYICLLHGKALAAQGNYEAAVATLQAGIVAAHSWEADAMLWQLQATLAHIYQHLRHHADAAQARDNAEATIQKLIKNISNETLRATFLQHAMNMLPIVRSLPTNKTMKAAYNGLTTREREIARLIAHGKSNKSIATTYTVSERTIETHVSNILSKLGFTTRAQIAAWAVAKGLNS